MGTTTSSDSRYQTTEDVNAILQGMTDASIDRGTAALPVQLRPGYQASLPTALAPQQASTIPVPSQAQAQPQQANQPNYTVGPVRPGDPGYQPPANPSWVAPVQNQPGQITPPNTDPRMVVRPPAVADPLVAQPPQQPQQQPRTGERPPLNSMPRLWNGGQVGPSGQTKQQFLTGRMMHESQGDPTALNYVARRDPRMYERGYTAGGLLQDLNTTWANGVKWASADPERYPMSQDPRKYQRAMDAPWDVQWQVNSAIYDHAGESPWREKDGSFRGAPGLGEMRNQMLDQRTNYQGLTPAPPRNFGEWGKQPAGMGMNVPGAMPRQSDFGRIMTGLAPLLLGIGSLALRLPLSTAVTAYGAMARAQQNGQEIEYQRNRTRYQDQLKEATAQQTLESQAASDAFSEYGNNNPQGLQQRLAQIALQYNDPTMYRMAERGDLNGIHQLQTRRDMLNQNLVKMNKAVQDEQDQQAQNAAVAAMDRKYQQEHPDATPDDLAIAHNEHIGQAGRAGTTRDPAAKPEQEGEVRDVLDKDGNRIRQVREGKTGGLFDLNGNPTTIDEKAGETLSQPSRGGAGGRDPTEGDYTWTNPDGSQGEGYAKIKGKQLVDAVTEEPIPTKPGTRVNKISAQSAGQAGNAARGTTGPIQDWDGMNEGKPPPGVTEADWVQAQDWARLGRAPPGLSSRSGAYQGAHDALPYALHAIGKSGASMPRDAIDYETQRTASTSTERYFTSGMGARQLTSLDTVAAHIQLFREYGAAVKSGDVRAINEAAGKLATATGSPELIDMGIAATITGDEVVRLLTQTGGTRGDREDIKDKLSIYSSPEQFEGIANTLTNFVRERYEPLRQQYTNRIGATEADKARYEEAFKNKITPAARAIIENKQPIAGGAQVQPMTEQQYNTAPSGTRYRLPGDPPDAVRVKP